MIDDIIDDFGVSWTMFDTESDYYDYIMEQLPLMMFSIKNTGWALAECTPSLMDEFQSILEAAYETHLTLIHYTFPHANDDKEGDDEEDDTSVFDAENEDLATTEEPILNKVVTPEATVTNVAVVPTVTNVLVPQPQTKEPPPPKTQTKELQTKKQIQQAIDRMRAVPQVPQRTRGWYEARHTMLTASNVQLALGTPASRERLIREKTLPCRPIEHSSDSVEVTEGPMAHGTRYEQMTQQIYAQRYGTTVEEFGCIPHAEYPFIGASPDGVNVDPKSDRFGRLLEIKNVTSRVIDGNKVKPEYYSQMQLQMAVCGLYRCDFVETKFVEFASLADFYAAAAAFRVGSKQIGIMAQFCRSGSAMYRYHTPVLDGSIYTPNYVNQWIAQVTSEFQPDEFMSIRTWQLEVFSLIEVDYDPDWLPSRIKVLTDVWNTVLANRSGNSITVTNNSTTADTIDTKDKATTENKTTTTATVENNKTWHTEPLPKPTWFKKPAQPVSYTVNRLDYTDDHTATATATKPRCLITLRKYT